jgi:hypothetical protein
MRIVRSRHVSHNKNMPLARIITDDAEEALELAIQLRSRGFQVETVAPGQIPATPADLEVELDSCDTDAVLSRIISFSGDADSCVFVAPGSLDESVGQQPHALPDIEWQPSKSQRFERTEEITADLARADRIREVEVTAEPVEGVLDFGPLPSEIATAETEIETPEPEIPKVAIEAHHHNDAMPGSVNDLPAVMVAQAEIVPAATTDSPAVIPHVPIAVDAVIVPEDPVPAVPLPQMGNMSSSLRSKSGDALFWRVAIPAAALATLIVLAGSLWQRRQPAAGALPTSASQQIPFHKAPAQVATSPVSASSNAGAVTTPDPPPAASPSPVSVAPQPVVTPQLESPSSESPVQKPATVAKVRTKKAKPQPQHHSTARSHDSGLVARDTVVYFDKKSGNPSGASNSSSK